MEKNNLLDYLIKSDQPCIYYKDQSLSYNNLRNLIDKRINLFIENGVEKFDKVIIASNNYIELIISFFALNRIKAVFVPFRNSKEYWIPDKEIIKPNFIFIKLEKDISILKTIFNKQENDKVSMIIMTSGTSGKIKAVPITEKMLINNSINTAKFMNLNVLEKILINISFYNVNSYCHLLTMMSVGASIVISDDCILGEDFFNKINEFNCTGLGGVPVQLIRYINYIEESKRKDRFFNINKSLRWIFNSGEHFPKVYQEKYRQILPKVKTYYAYDLTEVGGRQCISNGEKIGSVGKPIINQIKIKEGQVFINGKNLFKGYINGEVLGQDGFPTGDIGYIDEDRDLFLEERKDDIIKINGKKISLLEIEDIIYKCKDIKEFVVYFKFDEVLGHKKIILEFVKKEKIDELNIDLFLRENLIKNFPIWWVCKEKINYNKSWKKVRKI